MDTYKFLMMEYHGATRFDIQKRPVLVCFKELAADDTSGTKFVRRSSKCCGTRLSR